MTQAAPPGRLPGALVGAAQLAIGRGAGIERFGDTPQAFLASLAPLIAFPLVMAGRQLLGGSVLGAVAMLLVTVVAQLSPPVLSHVLAVRWGREAEWLRYATAFNWCQWAMPVALFGMLLGMQVASQGRLSEADATRMLMVGLSAYGLWLYWVVARHGLSLPRGRAALLVVLVNIGTVALVALPIVVGVLLG